MSSIQRRRSLAQEFIKIDRYFAMPVHQINYLIIKIIRNFVKINIFATNES